jgi:hypothetical protein
MATKYIVNNLTEQTIKGDLSVGGNLIITGATNSMGNYKALFTQTTSISGTSIGNFNDGLIIGETYTITTYNAPDDFSNIADVQSGNINETDCVFIATGSTPNVWICGTTITSEGNVVVDVIENTLGYDIDWVHSPFGGYGYYVGINAKTGPLPNSFPRNKVIMKSQPKYPFDWCCGGVPPVITVDTVSFNNIDSMLYFSIYDYYIDEQVDNALYYTPIEVNVKLDTDTTPIEVYGIVDASFGFDYVAVRLFVDGDIYNFYASDSSIYVNNLTELIALLNSDSQINFLGVFSEGGPDGIKLAMPTNFKNQIALDKEITFSVFCDN